MMVSLPSKAVLQLRIGACANVNCQETTRVYLQRPRLAWETMSCLNIF